MITIAGWATPTPTPTSTSTPTPLPATLPDTPIDISSLHMNPPRPSSTDRPGVHFKITNKTAMSQTVHNYFCIDNGSHPEPLDAFKPDPCQYYGHSSVIGRSINGFKSATIAWNKGTLDAFLPGLYKLWGCAEITGYAPHCVSTNFVVQDASQISPCADLMLELSVENGKKKVNENITFKTRVTNRGRAQANMYVELSWSGPDFIDFSSDQLISITTLGGPKTIPGFSGSGSPPDEVLKLSNKFKSAGHYGARVRVFSSDSCSGGQWLLLGDNDIEFDILNR